jgi:hypothetical protein
MFSRLQWKQWLTLWMATLQDNKIKEGVHLVVPPEFLSFFIASTSAGAALVGLLFVAVSIAPEQMVTCRAPMERQAVAGSAFTALINAFFISLVALIPHFNFGLLIVPFISLCLVTSLATLEAAQGLAEFAAAGLSGLARCRPLRVRTGERVPAHH